MKGERENRRSSLGSMMRKKLSDITNLQSQPKLRSDDDLQAMGTSVPDKGYIDQLLKVQSQFLACFLIVCDMWLHFVSASVVDS